MGDVGRPHLPLTLTHYLPPPGADPSPVAPAACPGHRPLFLQGIWGLRRFEEKAMDLDWGRRGGAEGLKW